MDEPKPPRRRSPAVTCTASSKRSGQRCRRAPVKGATVCASHGGKAPQVQRAARERRVEERARSVVDPNGLEPLRDPLDALQRVASEVVAVTVFLREEVNRLGGVLTYEYAAGGRWDDAGVAAMREDVRAVVAAYERSLDRSARVLSTIVKLDLKGRVLALQREQAETLAGALRAGMAACGIAGALRVRVEAATAVELDALIEAGAL